VPLDRHRSYGTARTCRRTDVLLPSHGA
jgi:hypothetical protein